MSGASAMAGARRRRTGVQEQLPGSYQSNRQVIISENNVQEETRIQLTPLQILKLHDDKIKKIEELLEEKTTMSDNSKQNIFDENKIINIVSQKIEGLVSQKLNNVNDTIKSILLNIEKLSNVANTNEKNLNMTQEFTNQLNALKMLVIKNQTLSLEINNEIFKIKDDLIDVKSNMNTDSNNDMPNANELLKSMFNNFNEDENIFSKINIEEDDNDNINIENLDITTIENLEEIRKDIVSEIIEKKIDNITDNIEDNNNLQSS